MMGMVRYDIKMLSFYKVILLLLLILLVVNVAFFVTFL